MVTRARRTTRPLAAALVLLAPLGGCATQPWTFTPSTGHVQGVLPVQVVTGDRPPAYLSEPISHDRAAWRRRGLDAKTKGDRDQVREQAVADLVTRFSRSEQAVSAWAVGVPPERRDLTAFQKNLLLERQDFLRYWEHEVEVPQVALERVRAAYLAGRIGTVVQDDLETLNRTDEVPLVDVVAAVLAAAGERVAAESVTAHAEQLAAHPLPDSRRRVQLLLERMPPAEVEEVLRASATQHVAAGVVFHGLACSRAPNDRLRGFSFPVGLLVTSLSGPAVEAGVRREDVIVKLDGKPITSSEEFFESLAKRQPGDVVHLSVVRPVEGLRELALTLGAAAAPTPGGQR